MSVNRIYAPARNSFNHGIFIKDEAKRYKRDVSFLTRDIRHSFRPDEEIIYFTFWGLKDKRNDSHNNEKLLWDALEYAQVYPNDRMLRHSAGSTYIMDKKGFVVVGLQKYLNPELVPDFQECFRLANECI